MEAEKIKRKKNHRINFTILQGPTFLYSLYLTSTFGLLTTQKPLTVWITTIWKILKMGMPDRLTCLLRSLYAGQEATVRAGHGTTDWFQIRTGIVKVVYCHPAYLTYMQSTSCKMPGWMRHKLESRMLGEISVTSDTQMTPPLWQKARN